MPILIEDIEGVLVRVKVTPRSSRNALAGVVEDTLRIHLTAPPVDGAANAALVEFLAGLCHLPKRNLTIVSGHTSRTKRVRIVGRTPLKSSRLLGLEISILGGFQVY